MLNSDKKAFESGTGQTETRTTSMRSDKKVTIGKYQVDKYLGSGSFATVYHAINLHTAKEVAIKIVEFQDIFRRYSKEPDSLDKLRTSLNKEHKHLLMCRSAHIIKLYETIEQQEFIAHILQYCNQGNLEARLKQRGSIQENDAIEILKQILFGLAEMHRNGIIHRDLKPANILMHQGVFKIADLGFSKEIPQEETRMHTFVGTRSTMAPEVANRQPYGLKADIWSVGVIFFLMLEYDVSEDYSQNVKKLQRFVYHKGKMKSKLLMNEGLSPEAKDFLMQTLQVDQNQRLSWQQTLNHPLFRKKFKYLPSVFVPYTHEQLGQLSDVSRSGEQGINPEQFVDWQLLNSEYLQVRKAEYFVSKLIVPLQSKHLLDFRQQQHRELMYLILVRCKTNLSWALNKVKQNYPPIVYHAFNDHLQELKDTIAIKFQHYSDLLWSYENKFSSIIKDRVSRLVNKSGYREKEKFLGGIEGLDFSKAEQISFTFENYIVDVINEVRGNSSDEEEVRSIMKNYRCLAQIKPADVQGKDLLAFIMQVIDSKIYIDSK